MKVAIIKDADVKLYAHTLWTCSIHWY